MANEDILYVANLDGSQILAELKKINSNVERVADQGDDAFKRIGDNAGASGASIGAVAGIVTALTEKFIELGVAAVKSLVNIATESVELAKVQRSAEGQLDATLESTGFAAGVAASELKTLASELQNLTNFGDEAIIGAESLLLTFTNIGQEVFPDATKAILDMSAKLGQDLKSSTIQLGKALNDPIEGISALSRVGVSFTQQQKDQVKTLVESGNTLEAQRLILAELNKEFGGSAEAARAADGNMTAFSNAVGDLQEQAGGPILDALGEQLGRTLELLAENQDTINLVAAAFGDVIAAVVDLLGTGLNDYLDSADPSALLDVADTIHDLVQIGGTFLSLAWDWISAILEFTDAISPTNDALGEAIDNSGGLSEILIFALDILAQSTAGWRGLIAVIQPTTTAISDVARAMTDLATGDFTGAAANAAAAFDSINEGLLDIEAGQQATNASYDASKKKLDELREALNSNNLKLQERKDALNQDNTAEIEHARILGQVAQAEKAAEEARAKATETQEKLAEETQKLNDKLLEIATKGGEKRLDELISNAQKREDIARSNARKIEDIERKHNRDIEDARKDIGRGGADLARKQGRERAELERSLANKRIDIESNFRQKLQDIQTKFSQAAEEAERSRDAVAFLRAQRQRDQEVSAAQTDKQSETQSAIQDAETQRQELAIRQQQEVEDARIANERKLEDLRQSLERRFEEQRIANERAEEDQTLSEQRKVEEFERQQQNQVEAARRASAQKLSDLTASLAQEIQATAQAEAQKTAIVQQQAAQRAAAIAAAQQQAEPGGSGSLSRGRRGGSRGRRPRRAFGGAAIQGQSLIVGDRTGLANAEIFTPAVSGSITPVSRLPAPITNNSTSIDNSIRAEVNQSLLDPSQQKAIMRQIARNEAQKILNDVFKPGRRA